MSSSYLTLICNNRRYRSLFLASSISLIGDWFGHIAIFTLLTEIGNSTGASALALALVFVLRQLPILLCSPLSGLAADTFPKGRILIASDLVRAACAGLLILSPFVGSSIYIYALLLVSALGTSFFDPARSAILPEVVERDQIVTASALGSMLWSIAMVVGSALGGITVEAVGWRGALAVDGLSYLASAYFVSRLGAKNRGPSLNESFTTPTIGQLINLLRYNKQIRALTLIKAWIGIGGGAYLLLVIFGQKIFTFGEKGALGISALYIARALGALLGPVWGRSLTRNALPKMRNLIVLGIILFSLSYASLGITDHWCGALVAVFFAHFGMSLVWVFSSVMLQIEAPAEYRGRIFGFELGMHILILSLSMLAYGYLLDLGILTPQGAAVTIGATTLLAAVWWCNSLRLWNGDKYLE